MGDPKDVLGPLLMRESLDHCVKCTICETYCPVSNVTPLFPGPKYVGPQAERFRAPDEPSADESDGKVTTWMVEGGSPNQLIRTGVTKNTVPVGTELVVEGYQAKDGTSKAVGRNFVLADGKRLFLGGSAGGGTDPAKAK